MDDFDKREIEIKELWHEMEHDVIYKNRIHPKKELFYEAVKIACRSSAIYNPNTTFYRARVYTEAKTLKDSENEQFYGYDKGNSFVNKNNEIIDNGRANLSYVAYLYMAKSEYTALAEVRPKIKDRVSIAKIINLDEMKIASITQEDCILIDTNEDMIKYQLIKAFSKPVDKSRPSDYILTQRISEEIKNLGYDGIQFNSSWHSGGINLTIFNYEKCEAVSSHLYKIADITFEALRINPNDKAKLFKTGEK